MSQLQATLLRWEKFCGRRKKRAAGSFI